jgi:hypothetical protein
MGMINYNCCEDRKLLNMMRDEINELSDSIIRLDVEIIELKQCLGLKVKEDLLKKCAEEQIEAGLQSVREKFPGIHISLDKNSIKITNYKDE